MNKKLLVAISLFYALHTDERSPPLCHVKIIEKDLFEEAVVCIKKYEGWHSAKNFPYVGYGHRLQPNEKFGANIPETFADSLLRKDLRQKCSVFRQFGKDSLLLGVLAYNTGQYMLLGNNKYPKSKLIMKLEAGDRDLYNEYCSFCRYKGKVITSLLNRRKEEFDLLFNKTKSTKIIRKMIKEGNNVVIVPSKELTDMRLSELVGRKGIVTEDISSYKRLNRGFMVRLTEGTYLGEEEWFIPFVSVQEQDDK